MIPSAQSKGRFSRMELGQLAPSLLFEVMLVESSVDVAAVGLMRWNVPGSLAKA
ncbi:hypothetical protein D3C86_2181740 [compost metagenome]